MWPRQGPAGSGLTSGVMTWAMTTIGFNVPSLCALLRYGYLQAQLTARRTVKAREASRLAHARGWAWLSAGAAVSLAADSVREGRVWDGTSAKAS